MSVETSMLKFGHFVGNTHTKTSVCGTMMTTAYEEAKAIIKCHVNAGKNDALIIDGTGVTGIINKFQRILGLRLPETYKPIVMASFSKDGRDRPVVFVSHMEHHRWDRRRPSNHEALSDC
jgi:selenocysteine lyase/cysteine desulfurase